MQEEKIRVNTVDKVFDFSKKIINFYDNISFLRSKYGKFNWFISR